ncbi:MAG: hypothetical protein CVV64_13585 [Candidatus Wallbacteria bacterium HGW-Wallbacteria-1]|jgi:ferredoxin|uniref:4Fe-4S ferredoxin-type domain-containing protein n=1 Tax=Candidatus Wallbacteria bacterium HGW-Wallbacteria-1 TaxID=2013854 RepID=A0A2N1PML6_9BACT|nr:MAG: hypothetical protein CVV64_13585 [Candidatus Wallbacteria bacterium HGW-Wallbacteria-1]
MEPWFTRHRRGFQIAFLLAAIAFFKGLLQSWSQEMFRGLHPIPVMAALSRLLFLPSLWFCLGFLILTAILGRFYCSHLCPVGFLQDLIAALLQRTKVKANRQSQPLSLISTFLGTLFFTALMTSMIMGASWYGWIDHFSNMGRIYTGLIAPGSSTLWLPVQNTFRQHSWLFLAGQPLEWNLPLVMGLLFMALLTLGTLFRPRWFCALLCPSGFIFSIVSRFNLRSVKLSPGCTSCGLCGRGCPAGAIFNGEADKSICMHCGICIPACPHSLLKLKSGNQDQTQGDSPEKGDGGRCSTRRRIIISLAGAITGIASGRSLVRAGRRIAAPPIPLSGGPLRGLAPVMPPGAGSLSRFMGLCASCGACVAACPTHVMKQSFLEQGLSAYGKPFLDYESSYCAFECNKCGAQCPAGAIMNLPLESRKLTRVGIAAIDRKLCIPYVKGEDCGACAEHCPTGAINTRREGGPLLPDVDPEYCIGCGVCQHACPVRPVRAVRVSGIDVQTMAARFHSAPQNSPESAADEFPF